MASAVAITNSVAALSAAASKTSAYGAHNAGVKNALPLSYASVKQSSFAGRSLTSGVRSFVQVRSRKASQTVRAAVEPEIETDDVTEQLKDKLRDVQGWWDRQEDKVAIVGLGLAGVVVLWASSGLLSSIDRLPVLPGFFEFVGILFTGWFVYRYLLFKPDREELLNKLEEQKQKITGEK